MEFVQVQYTAVYIKTSHIRYTYDMDALSKIGAVTRSSKLRTFMAAKLTNTIDLIMRHVEQFSVIVNV